MHRNMPVDLVLVRHGQSEGNLAQKLARQGRLDLWTSEFRDRHNSLYRLTDTGRMQARIAGEYIRNNISPIFDKYFTSEYVRAMETAATLELPHARWATEVYLRERDRGVLANKPHQERVTEHREEFVRKERDAFYWQPSGGESIANLCLRVDRVLENFGENCSGLRVIVVCHGGVIKSFRALIERVRSSEYRSHDKIHNCQIVWYTRRDPKTGYISSKYNWVKSLCPWDLRLSRFTNEWREVRRYVYSNVELLRSVGQVLQLVNMPLDQSSSITAHNTHTTQSNYGMLIDISDSSDSDDSGTYAPLPPLTSLKATARSASMNSQQQQQQQQRPSWAAPNVNGETVISSSPWQRVVHGAPASLVNARILVNASNENIHASMHTKSNKNQQSVGIHKAISNLQIQSEMVVPQLSSDANNNITSPHRKTSPGDVSLETLSHSNHISLGNDTYDEVNQGLQTNTSIDKRPSTFGTERYNSQNVIPSSTGHLDIRLENTSMDVSKNSNQNSYNFSQLRSTPEKNNEIVCSTKLQVPQHKIAHDTNKADSYDQSDIKPSRAFQSGRHTVLNYMQTMRRAIPPKGIEITQSASVNNMGSAQDQIYFKHLSSLENAQRELQQQQLLQQKQQPLEQQQQQQQQALPQLNQHNELLHQHQQPSQLCQQLSHQQPRQFQQRPQQEQSEPDQQLQHLQLDDQQRQFALTHGLEQSATNFVLCAPLKNNLESSRRLSSLSDGVLNQTFCNPCNDSSTSNACRDSDVSATFMSATTDHTPSSSSLPPTMPTSELRKHQASDGSNSTTTSSSNMESFCTSTTQSTTISARSSRLSPDRLKNSDSIVHDTFSEPKSIGTSASDYSTSFNVRVKDHNICIQKHPHSCSENSSPSVCFTDGKNNSRNSTSLETSEHDANVINTNGAITSLDEQHVTLSSLIQNSSNPIPINPPSFVASNTLSNSSNITCIDRKTKPFLQAPPSKTAWTTEHFDMDSDDASSSDENPSSIPPPSSSLKKVNSSNKVTLTINKTSAASDANFNLINNTTYSECKDKASFDLLDDFDVDVDNNSNNNLSTAKSKNSLSQASHTSTVNDKYIQGDSQTKNQLSLPLQKQQHLKEENSCETLALSDVTNKTKCEHLHATSQSPSFPSTGVSQVSTELNQPISLENSTLSLKLKNHQNVCASGRRQCSSSDDTDMMKNYNRRESIDRRTAAATGLKKNGTKYSQPTQPSSASSSETYPSLPSLSTSSALNSFPLNIVNTTTNSSTVPLNQECLKLSSWVKNTAVSEPSLFSNTLSNNNTISEFSSPVTFTAPHEKKTQLLSSSNYDANKIEGSVVYRNNNNNRRRSLQLIGIDTKNAVTRHSNENDCQASLVPADRHQKNNFKTNPCQQDVSSPNYYRITRQDVSSSLYLIEKQKLETLQSTSSNTSQLNTSLIIEPIEPSKQESPPSVHLTKNLILDENKKLERSKRVLTNKENKILDHQYDHPQALLTVTNNTTDVKSEEKTQHPSIQDTSKKFNAIQLPTGSILQEKIASTLIHHHDTSPIYISLPQILITQQETPKLLTEDMNKTGNCTSCSSFPSSSTSHPLPCNLSFQSTTMARQDSDNYTLGAESTLFNEQILSASSSKTTTHRCDDHHDHVSESLSRKSLQNDNKYLHVSNNELQQGYSSYSCFEFSNNDNYNHTGEEKKFNAKVIDKELTKQLTLPTKQETTTTHLTNSCSAKNTLNSSNNTLNKVNQLESKSVEEIVSKVGNFKKRKRLPIADYCQEHHKMIEGEEKNMFILNNDTINYHPIIHNPDVSKNIYESNNPQPYIPCNKTTRLFPPIRYNKKPTSMEFPLFNPTLKTQDCMEFIDKDLHLDKKNRSTSNCSLTNEIPSTYYQQEINNENNTMMHQQKISSFQTDRVKTNMFLGGQSAFSAYNSIANDGRECSSSSDSILLTKNDGIMDNKHLPNDLLHSSQQETFFSDTTNKTSLDPLTLDTNTCCKHQDPLIYQSLNPNKNQLLKEDNNKCTLNSTKEEHRHNDEFSFLCKSNVMKNNNNLITSMYPLPEHYYNKEPTTRIKNEDKTFINTIGDTSMYMDSELPKYNCLDSNIQQEIPSYDPKFEYEKSFYPFYSDTQNTIPLSMQDAVLNYFYILHMKMNQRNNESNNIPTSFTNDDEVNLYKDILSQKINNNNNIQIESILRDHLNNNQHTTTTESKIHDNTTESKIISNSQRNNSLDTVHHHSLDDKYRYHHLISQYLITAAALAAAAAAAADANPNVRIQKSSKKPFDHHHYRFPCNTYHGETPKHFKPVHQRALNIPPLPVPYSASPPRNEQRPDREKISSLEREQHFRSSCQQFTNDDSLHSRDPVQALPETSYVNRRKSTGEWSECSSKQHPQYTNEPVFSQHGESETAVAQLLRHNIRCSNTIFQAQRAAAAAAAAASKNLSLAKHDSTAELLNPQLQSTYESYKCQETFLNNVGCMKQCQQQLMDHIKKRSCSANTNASANHHSNIPSFSFPSSSFPSSSETEKVFLEDPIYSLPSKLLFYTEPHERHHVFDSHENSSECINPLYGHWFQQTHDTTSTSQKESMVPKSKFFSAEKNYYSPTDDMICNELSKALSLSSDSLPLSKESVRSYITEQKILEEEKEEKGYVEKPFLLSSTNNTSKIIEDKEFIKNDDASTDSCNFQLLSGEAFTMMNTRNNNNILYSHQHFNSQSAPLSIYDDQSFEEKNVRKSLSETLAPSGSKECVSDYKETISVDIPTTNLHFWNDLDNGSCFSEPLYNINNNGIMTPQTIFSKHPDVLLNKPDSVILTPKMSTLTHNDGGGTSFSHNDQSSSNLNDISSCDEIQKRHDNENTICDHSVLNEHQHETNTNTNFISTLNENRVLQGKRYPSRSEDSCLSQEKITSINSMILTSSSSLNDINNNNNNSSASLYDETRKSIISSESLSRTSLTPTRFKEKNIIPVPFQQQQQRFFPNSSSSIISSSYTSSFMLKEEENISPGRMNNYDKTTTTTTVRPNLNTTTSTTTITNHAYRNSSHILQESPMRLHSLPLTIKKTRTSSMSSEIKFPSNIKDESKETIIFQHSDNEIHSDIAIEKENDVKNVNLIKSEHRTSPSDGALCSFVLPSLNNNNKYLIEINPSITTTTTSYPYTTTATTTTPPMLYNNNNSLISKKVVIDDTEDDRDSSPIRRYNRDNESGDSADDEKCDDEEEEEEEEEEERKHNNDHDNKRCLDTPMNNNNDIKQKESILLISQKKRQSLDVLDKESSNEIYENKTHILHQQQHKQSSLSSSSSSSTTLLISLSTEPTTSPIGKRNEKVISTVLCNTTPQISSSLFDNRMAKTTDMTTNTLLTKTDLLNNNTTTCIYELPNNNNNNSSELTNINNTHLDRMTALLHNNTMPHLNQDHTVKLSEGTSSSSNNGNNASLSSLEVFDVPKNNNNSSVSDYSQHQAFSDTTLTNNNNHLKIEIQKNVEQQGNNILSKTENPIILSSAFSTPSLNYLDNKDNNNHFCYDYHKTRCNNNTTTTNILEDSIIDFNNEKQKNSISKHSLSHQNRHHLKRCNNKHRDHHHHHHHLRNPIDEQHNLLQLTEKIPCINEASNEEQQQQHTNQTSSLKIKDLKNIKKHHSKDNNNNNNIKNKQHSCVVKNNNNGNHHHHHKPPRYKNYQHEIQDKHLNTTHNTNDDDDDDTTKETKPPSSTTNLNSGILHLHNQAEDLSPQSSFASLSGAESRSSESCTLSQNSCSDIEPHLLTRQSSRPEQQ